VDGYVTEVLPESRVSKRFQMVCFKGSTQEKSCSQIFRFGYGKAANDKKVPDPVGSEEFL
jgi:hypothetical protein